MSLTAVRPPAIPSLPFHARGPLSALVMAAITAPVPADDEIVDAAADAVAQTDDAIRDDDLQLALFLLYGLAYGSFGTLGADREWDPQLLRVRAIIEAAFEQRVRELTPIPPLPDPLTAATMADALFDLTAPSPGPSMARYIEKKATAEQVRETLILRSIYTLREADPHSWAIPRLTGRAKAALVEIQSDEYGGGRPDRMHAVLYANAMRAAGLNDTYGFYVDRVPAVTLASQNLMSMFGMNRRLLGAVVGHLAAFEMTSSLPNRRYADGMRRLGFGPDVTAYFDEHVEADAVHEQIAGRDLAGGLAEDQPDFAPDILFGAAACLLMDDLVADYALGAWDAGRSALRPAPETP
jgi:hypothetical protein